MTTLCGPPLSGAEGVGPLTLGGFLTEVAGRFADHEALVFDDPLSGGATIRWSYAELLYHARRVAKALVAVGVSKGTRVGILMGNRPESVAAFFGAPMAGAIAVPLSTFSPQPELDYLLRHADMAVLCTQGRLLGRNFVDDIKALCPVTTGVLPIESDSFPFLRRVAVVGLGVGRGRCRPGRSKPGRTSLPSVTGSPTLSSTPGARRRRLRTSASSRTAQGQPTGQRGCCTTTGRRRCSSGSWPKFSAGPRRHGCGRRCRCFGPQE